MSGVEIVFPARAKGTLACASGTKFYLDGAEITDVSKFSMPETGPDDLMFVTLTFPIKEISYAEE